MRVKTIETFVQVPVNPASKPIDKGALIPVYIHSSDTEYSTRFDSNNTTTSSIPSLDLRTTHRTPRREKKVNKPYHTTEIKRTRT